MNIYLLIRCQKQWFSLSNMGCVYNMYLMKNILGSSLACLLSQMYAGVCAYMLHTCLMTHTVHTANCTGALSVCSIFYGTVLYILAEEIEISIGENKHCHTVQK